MLSELMGSEPDLTLAKIEARLLSECKVRTTHSSIDRFFKRHEISIKKRRTPPKQNRSGKIKAGQAGLDPGKPVFLDKTEPVDRIL